MTQSNTPDKGCTGFEIHGSLGGPGPDGFWVAFRNDLPVAPFGSGAIYPSEVSVFFTPDQFRKFFGDAGDELKAFDEAAGEPSN